MSKKYTTGDMVTFYVMFILFLVGAWYGMKWHYEHNVLPNFTEEDKKEMRFFSNLTIPEYIDYVIKDYKVNGFRIFKKPGEVKFDELDKHLQQK